MGYREERELRDRRAIARAYRLAKFTRSNPTPKGGWIPDYKSTRQWQHYQAMIKLDKIE